VERTIRAQMEKDKISRERNFIFKLVREYYKQWRVKKAQTLKTIEKVLDSVPLISTNDSAIVH